MVNQDILDFGPDFDLDMLGIPDFKLIETEKLEPGCDEDSVPEHVEPKTKLGDIYKLGNHRLMCGDSTSIDAVEKLMNGEKADIGFTSPPYNANKNNGGLIEKKYQNSEDEMDDDEYVSFLSAFTLLTLKFTRFSFINIQMLSHNKMPLFKWQSAFKDKIKDIFVWVKSTCPPQINKGTFNSKW
jgi:DNA modification methylase